uniref:Lariatin biosynthetic protein n=1 Tax=Rhodococcus jostii TaxID=132919 RepID=H7C8I7_RHOJO|nr:lariatin biosynthetic protein [Rhodococcus jostii]
MSGASPTPGAKKHVLRLFDGHWLAMASAMGLTIAAGGLAILQPSFAGRIVDAVSNGSSITSAAAILVVALLGQILLDTVGHYQFERIGEKVVYKMRCAFALHVVNLPVADIDGHRTGDLLSRASNDTAMIREIPRSIGDILFGAVSAGAAVVLMFSIDPVLVAMVIAVIVVAFLGANQFLKRIQLAAGRRQVAVGEYASGLDRTLSAIRTVKLFRAEQREIRSIVRSADHAYTAGVRTALLIAAGTPVVQLAITGCSLLILVVGGSRVARNELTLGELVSLFMYTMYAVMPLSNLFGGLALIRTAMGSLERLLETLNRPVEGAALSRSASTGEHRPASSTSLVEFDRVSFAYGTSQVIDDVSFSIDRNQVTAIVGSSGAGKTSIISLACRFYEPTAGIIRWEGEEYQATPIGELRRHLALVEQDAPVMHGTIRENLQIANPESSDGEIWTALKHANLAPEIECLPDGLDTVVLDHGRSLSGGQRQRLAVARALLSRAELILMDEPTAHLDRVNELELMQNLIEWRGARSLLVVAHRLSTVTRADRILVLDAGRIVATGTHLELVEDSAAYRRLIEQTLGAKPQGSELAPARA